MGKRADQEVIQRIEMGGGVSEIIELCLDGIAITHISTTTKRILQRCVKLEYLAMNDCGLQSLSNFPKISTLIALELSGNKLTGECLGMLSNVGQVSFLSLDQNRIAELRHLQDLRCLPQLEILELENNEITQNQGYKEFVFSKIPSLVSIDGRDRLGNDTTETNEDYITNRHRSNPHLSDCEGEEQEEELSLENMVRAQPVKILKKESSNERVGKFQLRQRREDSEEEDESKENGMMKEFKKRMNNNKP